LYSVIGIGTVGVVTDTIGVAIVDGVTAFVDIGAGVVMCRVTAKGETLGRIDCSSESVGIDRFVGEVAFCAFDESFCTVAIRAFDTLGIVIGTVTVGGVGKLVNMFKCGVIGIVAAIINN